MRIGWARGSENIDFDRPHTWFILGVRGSGKSSFIEHVGELYLDKGHIILDLFGSRDGEGLAWLRNPNVSSNEILLIHGDNVDVKAPCDERAISDLTLDDFNDYRVLISSSPLYSSPDDEFLQVNRITDLLYKRRHWNKLIYVVVREAANLYYSRLKVRANQTQAKAEMTYLIREARHMGMAMGLDTLKYTSIDIDIRAVTDYLIFKAQGIMGFPSDLSWLYGYLDPHYTRRMKKNEFYILARAGSIGLGTFPEVKWHKQEREHITKKLGIEIEYREEIDYGQDKGAFKTLSDYKHAEMVTDYIEGKGSMVEIGRVHEVSNATVHNHTKAHNRDIHNAGECPRCRRVDSEYSKTWAKRPRKKKIIN